MASSVTVTYLVKATVAEVLDSAKVPAAADGARTVTHSGFDTEKKILSGASTPPVSLVACMAKALSGGAATIDLTALTGTNLLSIDGTGLRVQILRLKNPATNANPITIAKGASAGYDGLGAAFSHTVVPGGEATFLTNDAGSDIGAGNKTLDLAGTGSQVLDVEIVLG